MLNGLIERRPTFGIRSLSLRQRRQARAVTSIEGHTAFSSSSLVIPKAGSLLLGLYLLYFFLVQSHTLWQSPTLVSDRWRSVFYPFIRALPYDWVRAPKNSGPALLNSGLFLLLLAGLFAVYLWAVKRAFRPGAVRAREVREALAGTVAFLVLALLVLMVVPGVLSTDLFSYVWYGHILVDFGQSPLTHVPADYTFHDPGGWMQWVFWRETPSVYGPLWVMLAGAIAQISNALGGDIVNHILGHRIVASLSHLANVALIWKLSGLVISKYWRRSDLTPGITEADWLAGARLAVTLAYAWNPLMVIEMGANSHNDVLMLTGVLLALWLHLTGRWRLALLALALSGLIKEAVVVFVPGYLWLIFWEAAPGGITRSFAKRAGRLAQALLIMAGTWVLFYIPFWEGPATLKPLVSGPAQEYFVNSIGEFIRFKLAQLVSDLARVMGWQPADFWSMDAVGWRLDWPARWGPTLITAAVALTQTWRARTFSAMLIAWGWTIFAYLTVGAVWFWPWYVSWLVIVAVLAGPGRLLNATQILCVSSMALYGMYWQGDDLFRELAGWRPLFIMAPPLAYVIAAAWLSRRRAAPGPQRSASRTAPDMPLAVPVPISPQPLRARPWPEGYSTSGQWPGIRD
jgi:hypothetical protein